MATIQEQLHDNHCWGCGAEVEGGLRLASTWDGERAVAHWTAWPIHAAGPKHFVNGGIIATLLDCHGICTALAAAYGRAGRPIGSTPEIWHATTALDVRYLRPTPIDAELRLTGVVVEQGEGSAVVECTLEAAGRTRATARLESVVVPDSWRHGSPG